MSVTQPEAARSPCTQEDASAKPNHHFASLQWNVWLLGKAELEGNCLQTGHIWEKLFQLFKRGKKKPKRQPFLNLSVKGYFFLMTHDNCQILNLQTHIQLTATHITNSVSVILAHWDPEHKGELRWWVTRASREQTSLKPNFCPQQTKTLPLTFQYFDINTEIILNLKQVTTSLHSYLPTCLPRASEGHPKPGKEQTLI